MSYSEDKEAIFAKLEQEKAIQQDFKLPVTILNIGNRTTVSIDAKYLTYTTFKDLLIEHDLTHVPKSIHKHGLNGSFKYWQHMSTHKSYNGVEPVLSNSLILYSEKYEVWCSFKARYHNLKLQHTANRTSSGITIRDYDCWLAIPESLRENLMAYCRKGALYVAREQMTTETMSELFEPLFKL